MGFLTLQLARCKPALIGIRHVLAIALLASTKSATRWLIHLGGPRLILLGLIDNSVIPLPGSTDVVTILLAAHHREP